MSEAFDPYYQWLGIPPNEQPPDHYRLLGTQRFETNEAVIANAADRQMTFVQTYKTGPHSAESQRLLNEISTARVTLLNAAKKAEYDARLKAQLAAQAPPVAAQVPPVAMAPPVVAAPPGPAAWPAPGAMDGARRGEVVARPQANPTVLALGGIVGVAAGLWLASYVAGPGGRANATPTNRVAKRAVETTTATTAPESNTVTPPRGDAPPNRSDAPASLAAPEATTSPAATKPVATSSTTPTPTGTEPTPASPSAAAPNPATPTKSEPSAAAAAMKEGAAPAESPSAPSTPLQPEAAKTAPAPEAKPAAAPTVPAKPPKSPDAGQEFVNSVGMKFLWCLPGQFVMGSPDDEAGRDGKRETEHEVRLTKGYWLAVYETTQGQYEAVTGKNPSHFSASGEGAAQVAGLDTKDFPVDRLSWFDAEAFCKQLSEREGMLYRFPTEAEWEYACRAGRRTPFAFGRTSDATEANFNGTAPYGVVSPGPNLGRPTTVGSYPPNTWGFYDMHGNMWEWCSDWYSEYPKEGKTIDPKGADSGTYRMYRGGGWESSGDLCRSARRSRSLKGVRENFRGVRVVLDGAVSEEE